MKSVFAGNKRTAIYLAGTLVSAAVTAWLISITIHAAQWDGNMDRIDLWSGVVTPQHTGQTIGVAEQERLNQMGERNQDNQESVKHNKESTIVQKGASQSQSQPQPQSQSQSVAAPVHDLSLYPQVEVVATGYYAGIESTGKDPSHPQYGITYSGVKVRRDFYSTIAADPRVFPLGTILYVPGYGYGVVADTGSAIKGNIIDLYFESIDDIYKQWGKKSVDVYVIRRGDGQVSETMLNSLNERKT